MSVAREAKPSRGPKGRRRAIPRRPTRFAHMAMPERRPRIAMTHEAIAVNVDGVSKRFTHRVKGEV